MPTHRCLRPIIDSAAYQLPPIPRRLLCSPITHQYHHRRTTATLRPPNRPPSYAFSAGLAIAALFGGALWLLPQHSTNATGTVPSQVAQAIYEHIVEECIEPELHEAFHEYLGCQNVGFKVLSVPDDRVAEFPDLQMGLYLDADAFATSEDGKGTVVGLRLISRSREEKELVAPLRQIFEGLDKEGALRRKGKAVCLIGCKGVDGIWVYGEEGEKEWWWKAGIFRV